MLLSKVIDNNDVNALKRFGIDADHFETAGERETYRFIVDYAERNRGQAPDFRTVVAECQAFDYQPNVEDSYEYLARQVKQHAAKQEYVELFSGDRAEAVRRFETEKDFTKYIEWLTGELERIKIRTDVSKNIGTDLRTVGEQFLAEYERRKAGDSFRVWKSKFSVIGNYTSGNMYVVYGKSGRGKSVI